MFKKIISLLILTMYMHGMSGYTMSFHTCTITGSENVYTGFGMEDPCGEEDNDCHETTTHFEQAECCDIQQTVVSVDDKSDVSAYKNTISSAILGHTFIQLYIISNTATTPHFYTDSYTIRPPEPCSICVFRI